MAGPKPPKELKVSGRALWRAVLGQYELEQHELAMLTEMCRSADVLDDLAAIVSRDGVLDPLTGKAHPAVIEARQQKIAFARLTAALRLPAGDQGEEGGELRRPQRRVGARGVYGITGAVA